MDLFGGSGSTLIACEQTDRICRTMELDPKYATVIVERFYQYFVEHKNSTTNVDDEIYVIRDGKRMGFSGVATRNST